MGRPPRNSIGSSSSNATSLASLSHVRELDTNHRSWLARSLDKNDAEIAALEKLNKILRSLKQEIIKRDGSEEILIEAASAISNLDNGLLFTEEVEACIDGMKEDKDDENDELLKNFFLHMKLRRKILNRFARRLNRLARSMDGETVGVGPPIPPKYGDPPVAIDMKKMEEFSKKRERFEEYEEEQQQRKIEKEENELKKRKQDHLSEGKDMGIINKEEDADKPVTIPQEFVEYEIGFKEAYASLAESESLDKKNPGAPDLGVLKYGVGIGATNRAMSYKEKIAEYQRWEHDLLVRIPPQPTFKELGMNEIFDKEARKLKLKESKEAEVENDEDLDEGDDKRKASDTNDTEESQHTSDNCRDSDDDDSKSNGSTKEDVSMEINSKEESSIEEKSMEETSIEETSMEEKALEERSIEEKSMDDVSEKSQDDTKDDKDGSDIETDKKEDGAEEIDKEDVTMKEKVKDEETESKNENSNETNKANEDNDKGSKKDEVEHEKKEEIIEKNTESVLSKLKQQVFFSLQAVPSFYNQDLRRIRAVHTDLMESTKKAHIQRLVTEATNEYNQALRVSNDLNNLRQKLQGDISRLMYSARSMHQKKKGDYAVEVAIAKNKWQRRKDIWEQTQKKKVDMMNIVYSGQLKTRVIVEDIVSSLVEKVGYRLDRRRFPNPMITRGDPVREAAASILSDMKDTIVTHITAESFSYNPNEKFEAFVPPPDETQMQNNSLTLEFQMRQKQIQNDINICETKLMKNEEERKRAWKRLAKVKAEAAGFSMVARATEHSFPPVPQLKGSKMYSPPANSEFMSSYNRQSTPRQNPVTTLHRTTPAKEYKDKSSSDAPKSYSESLKARIFSDGSIKPVMAPKKLKDGTYQRPAGRKRKGMDWDAVRGVWTPTANPSEGKSQEDFY